ncbi:PRD domain-containing protein [Paucisalibacillus sp. EB02]|uniref:PRD domain-containing protein n=1 Tax=Paucisalibacillus sp. EB02 TaxID=1347087 RepID=UPI0004BC4C7D|nr:PRD domain-containing protein [Paucisalibacillus sp. EB02]
MQVIKVLNNSLLLAVDKEGYEVVLMGKGIGFNKAIGHKIGDKDIEKTFVLKNRDVSRNIIQLANEIDVEYFEMAKMIIDYAIDKYEMNLMEYIYLSLTDHIAQTVKRIQSGIVIPNLYNAVIRQFNIREYDIGAFATELMKEKTGVSIPDEEIGNIAIHFINAQKDNAYQKNDNEISYFVNSILGIVKDTFQIDFDVRKISFNRFIIHLQSFSHRLIHNLMTDDDPNDHLYTQVSTLYPKEKNCSDKIADYIKEKYNITISHQEIVYLTIHIRKTLMESGGELT